MRVCKVCFTRFIEYTIENKQLAKCMNPRCNSEYTIVHVRKFAKHLLQEFARCSYKAIYNKFINKIEQVNNQKMLLQKIREENMKFINEFPAAVGYVIKVALQHKQKQITSKNRIIINNEKPGLKCFNLFCTGFLDDDFKCRLCEVQFCKNCERCKTVHHQCKQDDVATIQMIKSIVKCPNCKVPVVKSEGCNYMTCARCQTNFDYIDGTVTEHGNHGKYIPISDTSYTLSQTYKEYGQAIVNLLAGIERLQPQNMTEEIIAKKFVEKQSPEEILKYYTKYIKNKNMIQTYIRCLNMIEEEHKTKGLTLKFVNDILNLLTR